MRQVQYVRKIWQAKADRNQARLDCAVAERNHMQTLERFLEAQEHVRELQAENKALKYKLFWQCGKKTENWRNDNE